MNVERFAVRSIWLRDCGFTELFGFACRQRISVRFWPVAGCRPGVTRLVRTFEGNFNQ
jgi:hypothetical protein